MKRLLVLIPFLALSLYAADRPARMIVRVVTAPDAMPVTDPTLLPRVFEVLRANQIARHNAHAAAIADSRSARTFIIPVAGSAPGGGGTLFFRSDVAVRNCNSTVQNVLVVYWPAGTSNPPSSTLNAKVLTLPANSVSHYIDFVATVMNSSGLGSLLFIPITGTSAGSTVDSNAAIDGFSRIYTKQPGSNGTVSQPFDGIDVDSLSTSNVADAYGLRQDTDFRTNFGIVNADDVTHNFKVMFVADPAFGSSAQSTINVTVPAHGMIQQAMPAGTYGPLAIEFEVTDYTNSTTWFAYASSTDNTTGDGWVSVATAPFSGADLDKIGF